VNLAGYLAGVLAARHLAASSARAAALRAGLAATALATLLGASTSAPLAWLVLRAAAGVASGLVFVLASAAALERAAPPGKLYGGVGFGIALSGAVAALTPASAGWQAPWLVLGIAAAVLPVAAWRHLAPVVAPTPRDLAPGDDPATLGFGLGRLSAAYFLEGLGYIVSGTFAVAAVRRTPGLEALAPWTWVLTGLAAAPSALFWSALARRVGLRRALVVAHLTQAAGMALPSVSSSAAAALGGAALFGGTMIGVVALAMSAGRALAPATPGRVVGTLTAGYGVGQIIGPLAAGALSDRLGDPRPAVLVAAGAVALGGLLLLPANARARPASSR
jgi:MFS family permease